MIERWVIANKIALEELADVKIPFQEFLERMVKVPKNKNKHIKG